MAVPASTSLNVAVAHAVSFLTRPLIIAYPATTIIRLQLVLEANLTATYAPSWVPKEPLRGSGRRCLTLSPNCLPPRAVYAACLAAGIQWFDWMTLLGGREFDFFVDPGCVSIRIGHKGTPGSQLITIWSDELPSPIEDKTFSAITSTPFQAEQSQSKTLAQQILEEDNEEDIFTMIADEIAAPTWMTPILDQFPVPNRSSSPLSAVSTVSSDSVLSRCSSRSSNSSSGFSQESSATSVSAMSSVSGQTNYRPQQPFKQSRRERARQARVFVDTTKTEVTPYDGGKTTVLTGGVMLGGASGAAKAKKTNNTRPAANRTTLSVTTNNWRTARA